MPRITYILIAALLYVSSLIGMYVLGMHDGKQIQAGKALVAYREGVQKNARIDKQVSILDEPGLNYALSKWLR